MEGKGPMASWRDWNRRRFRALREERLDRMIDALNEERRPPVPAEPEEAELLAVARMLKSLRGASDPAEGWRPLVAAGQPGSSMPGRLVCRRGGAKSEVGGPWGYGGGAAGRGLGTIGALDALHTRDAGDRERCLADAGEWEGADALGGREQDDTRAVEREGAWTRSRRRRVGIAAAALIAGLALAATFAPWPQIPGLSGWLRAELGLGPAPETDVVYAMEQAVAQLRSYHGVLEKRAANAAGETWLVRRIEVWVDGDRYMTRDDTGVVTVHDGRRKWQVRPAERVVAVLPPLPDVRPFDLEDQARAALRYSHQVVGREQVAGRDAIRLRIEPPGGLPYDLWVDAETHLPLRLRTAMQNGLQTETTFVRFEANAPVDLARFRFEVPAGYRVEEENPGQLVDTPAEAAAIAGFTPLLPGETPRRILAARDRVVLDYGETVIVEEPAQGPFEPQPNAALGAVGQDGVLEVFGERLRWRQQGLEITVEGPQRVELARALAPDIQLPDPNRDPGAGTGFDPEVEVSVDMEVERGSQQQVDAGHSPWMLDPVQVAGAFLLGQFGEQVGDYGALVDRNIRVVHNDGRRAVVEVQVGPVARVYLKRLVRQDETGIWTVVGYDPRGS
ncbi:hypothetical protein Tmar_1952 [Thermaerobacter marianensis DSM 12885]|uniref:MucB/RseB N-terminal domain-containing protein n=1 Tax=Thermaerobacter marianensis (strain ATCC 700841 / DSM 12885 / JCM 10246 / 7p75a) TaxID=644966 RepID=E6SIU1_THEM7|nr:sigma-E factor regulatory protein RseB domain-containing protein [Thermaerobacter marianensis]ADU52035.1 hypothetical protein Tmar_1952 [Thermaerobacter marianensis DSM 12885]